MDTEIIRRAIELFDWKKAFANTSVDIFNKTIRNILPNFIPHEILLVDEKDSRWLTSEIKNLINEKNSF